MKIICKSMDGGLIMSNTYQGPSGEQYLFQRNIPTEIKNKEDADYFLKCGDGKFFGSVGKIDKIVDTLKTAMTGNKPDNDEVLTEQGAYMLNKKEQAELIKTLGGVNTAIPHYEKGRVELILKLQGYDNRKPEPVGEPDKDKSPDNEVDELLDDVEIDNIPDDD